MKEVRNKIVRVGRRKGGRKSTLTQPLLRHFISFARKKTIVICGGTASGNPFSPSCLSLPLTLSSHFLSIYSSLFQDQTTFTPVTKYINLTFFLFIKTSPSLQQLFPRSESSKCPHVQPTRSLAHPNIPFPRLLLQHIPHVDLPFSYLAKRLITHPHPTIPLPDPFPRHLTPPQQVRKGSNFLSLDENT